MMLLMLRFHKLVSATLLTLDQKLVKALAATSYNVVSFNNFEVPLLS
jgi:hypothetical protein